MNVQDQAIEITLIFNESLGSAKIGSPLDTRLYAWYKPPSTTILGLRAIARFLYRQLNSTSQLPKAWHR